MKTTNSPELTLWSREVDSEDGLRKFIFQLMISTDRCFGNFNEASVEICLQHAKYVYSTVDHLATAYLKVTKDLLITAIETISRSIKIIEDGLERKPLANKKILRKKLLAVTNYRDDLKILMRYGRMAYFTYQPIS